MSSDDLEGLRLVRDRGPAGMGIAAGECGFAMPYSHQMLDAQAVDCLQIDVTRCTGLSAFLQLIRPFDARALPPASAVPVRLQLRRCHDGSLISAHCCAASAREALEHITVPQLMGATPPGPLAWANAELIDTTTGQAVGWTGALVPLDGQPSADGPGWP